MASDEAEIFFHEHRAARPSAQGFQSDIPAPGENIEERRSLDRVENVKKRFLYPIGGRPDAASCGKADLPPPGLPSDDSHRYFWIRISAI